ncbi:MAG: FAD-binding oxidoreductase [Planctomycetota bacterium]
MSPTAELRPGPPESPADDCPSMEGTDEYRSDESRMQGPVPEVIYLPRSTAEAALAVRRAREAGLSIAVGGGRTGIAGGAVPSESCAIVSVERLTFEPELRRVGEEWRVRVGAGTTLDELQDYLDGNSPETPLLYPVDSTERSATIGGTIATNASGARTLFYGPTRDWVRRLRVVTAGGRVLDLERGNARAEDGMFYICEDGERRRVPVEPVPRPGTKHTAGYYLQEGMDAVDLFVGSEGTLGIVTEAELALAEKPPQRLFVTFFIRGDEDMVRLVRGFRREDAPDPLALEYLDPRAVELVREDGAHASILPDGMRAGLYAEFAFEGEAELESIYDGCSGLLRSAGLDPARSWAGFGRRDMEQMKDLRHAVPEAVNARIGQIRREHPDVHKVGTDMAVPPARLEEMMELYRRRVEEEDLRYVIFGHAGDGHVHVNILPGCGADVEKAEELYEEFAGTAVRLGGSVAAEHGIGRIKKPFLRLQYSPEELDAMRRVKEALDPAGALNPGVLL